VSHLAGSNRASGWKRIFIALVIGIGAPTGAFAQSAPTASQSTKDIIEVATEAGSFTTLLTALKAAGLSETLRGDGPFTVFAPSDAAFAKLPKTTLDALLADKTALTSVLTFHVVPGRVLAGDIVKSNGATPITINGQPLDIRVRDGKVYVNGAQVVTADLPASNGVIHVVDSVLLPTPPAAGR
jgi:uncharacterized surface protein with fasciclin (FAS1) repeats